MGKRPPGRDPIGFGARSDPGRVRDGNEDRYFARPPLFAVADGMGGHRAGEVAAQIAIDELARVFEDGAAASAPGLADAVVAANRAIRDAAARDAALSGMGTTLTVALLDGSTLHLAHVGDSRAYRLRNGSLETLTDDHTLVGALVRNGALSEAEARGDDRRHIVTRALGIDPHVEVDTRTVPLEPGDRLLLCSDGLTGEVDDPEVARTLLDEPDPDRAAERLVSMANAAGGADNVTVVVIDSARTADGAASVHPVAAGARRGRVARRLAALLAVLLATLAVVALAVGGFGPAGFQPPEASSSPEPSISFGPASPAPSPTPSPSPAASGTPVLPSQRIALAPPPGG